MDLPASLFSLSYMSWVMFRIAGDAVVSSLFLGHGQELTPDHEKTGPKFDSREFKKSSVFKKMTLHMILPNPHLVDEGEDGY